MAFSISLITVFVLQIAFLFAGLENQLDRWLTWPQKLLALLV